MLKFQWNALRRGDTVFIHDAADADLGLHAGVVTLVDVHQPVTMWASASPPTPRAGRSFDPHRLPSTTRPSTITTAGVPAAFASQRPAIAIAIAVGPRPQAPSRSVMAVAALSIPVSMTPAIPPDQRAPGCLPNRPAARTPIPRLLRETATT